MGFWDILRRKKFPCPHCGLDYILDADGVRAAKNTSVRRRCGKCGKSFEFKFTEDNTVKFKD